MKKIKTLTSILRETEDKQFYVEKIKRLEDELSVLNEKLQFMPERKSGNIMYQIEQFIDDIELNINDYFNTLVRNLIEAVMGVSQHEINIKYICGMEKEMKL